jgi:ribosomal protein S18 acetylase RimI-like enzyme
MPPAIQVRVRPVELSDAAALAVLMQQLGYPTNESEMWDRLGAISANTDYYTLVAELLAGAISPGASPGQAAAATEPRVVGMIGLRVGVLYEKNGLHGQVMALVVDRECQGAGIGSLLVEGAERWFRDKGVHSVVLGSGYQRTAAHQFYERLGFRATGKRFIKAL